MKKWLLAVAMAVGVSALFVDVPGHKLEASAKYKTYISKTYRDGDGNSNPTGFFAGNFKKTLPSGLVVKNSSCITKWKE